MPAPYEKEFEIEVDEAGGDTYVRLAFPHRGRLTKLILSQLDGVLSGFDCDLYNSSGPMDQANSSASVSPDVVPANHKILPTQVAAPAAERIEVFNSQGYSYRNVDGTYSVPERFLYLRLGADGTGPKSFRLSLTMLPAV